MRQWNEIFGCKLRMFHQNVPGLSFFSVLEIKKRKVGPLLIMFFMQINVSVDFIWFKYMNNIF